MQNLYVGRAGQAMIMGEFLIRGYNVASPEVDRGDDLFVVRDEDGVLKRIQVKTANAVERKSYGFSASFTARYDRLEQAPRPDMTFVFIVRRHDRWEVPLLITRRDLFELHEARQVGKLDAGGKKVSFNLKFKTSDGDIEVSCDDVDLTKFRGDWSAWPLIEH